MLKYMSYINSITVTNNLIEEITSLDFDQIVSTYNYSEAKVSVKDASGAVFTDSNYANFSRKVATKYVYVPQESGDGAVKYIMATVAVYYDGRSILTVNRLITR